MKSELPADIARLTGDADFLFPSYREFKRPKPVSSDPEAPEMQQTTTNSLVAMSNSIQPEEAEVSALRHSHHALRSAAPAGARSMSGGRAITVRTALPAASPESLNVTRTVVEPGVGLTAWRGLRFLAGPERELDRPGRARQRTTIAVYPSCGGCGATTLLATLARLLSAGSEQIAVVDDSTHSLLANHFGSRSSRRGICSFLQTGEGTAAAIHIVTPPDKKSRSGWIKSSIDQLDGDYDRLLIEVPQSMNGEDLAWLLERSAAIVPILPDVRSVLSLDAIVSGIRSLHGRLGCAAPVYFLLTQFDANSRLHVDILNWIEASYPGLLLPFTIRRGDEVSEALADGSTVVDYAPNSGIAHDYRQLAQWVQALPDQPALPRGER